MSLMPAFSPYTSAYRFYNLAFVQKDTTTLPNLAQALQWNTDGSTLFVISRDTSDDDTIFAYDTSTNWNIGTLSSGTNITLPSVPTSFNAIEDFRFNSDGTKVFVKFNQGQIYEYSLSAPYGGTATYNADISTGKDSSFIFANDGTTIITVDTSQGFFEVALSTPYDLTTAGSISIKKFDLSGTFSSSFLGLGWGKTEKKLIIAADGEFHEYELSTAGDISSASFVRSYDPSSNFSAAQATAVFGDAGRRFFAVGAFEGIAEWSSTA